MKMIRNIEINSKVHDKQILADLFFTENDEVQPLIIFSHGFKGFKDWGHWDMIAAYFAEAGFCFLKFNFSHNGTTVNAPDSFGDLEAFSQNNYTLEISDLGEVLDTVLADSFEHADHIDLTRVALIGHSRGGAVSLLKGNQDDRVSAVIGWAPIYDIGSRWSAEMRNKWKADDIHYISNRRTRQQMPMDYQIVQNYVDNQDILDVPRAIRTMKKPLLIIHGDQDEAIDHEEGMKASLWNRSMSFETIKGAGHTFGGTHPMNTSVLPVHSQILVNKTRVFLADLFAK